MSKWKPINTAPRDRTQILARGFGLYAAIVVYECQLPEGFAWELAVEGDWCKPTEWEPEEWRPIPAD